jgi:hypothetical protein
MWSATQTEIGGAKMLGVLSAATRASELANFVCDVALTRAASDQQLGSTDQAHSVKKIFRVETILRRFALRNSPNAFNFVARSPYHYYRVKRA